MRSAFTFRPNTCDHNVFVSVVENNEYRLPESLAGATIIDLGAHIGSFSQAVLERGAAHVLAFEPEHDNFGLFRKHLADEIALGQVEIFPLAVAGSGVLFREHSGPTSIHGEVNTGGGFLYGLNGEYYVLPEYITSRRFRVPSIDLTNVFSLLPNDQKVDILKLDIEGSEWEVLFGPQENALGHLLNIGRCRSIIGEYHSFGENTADRLSAFFHDQGFNSNFQQHGDSPLGLFWANRV